MKREQKKSNKPTAKAIWVLSDLVFNGSMNKFEEIYGEHITYKELKQYSYIELKEMINESIGKVKKIRKVRDDSKKVGLTCRIQMTEEQYDKLLSIYSSNQESGDNKSFKFLYGFTIK